MLLRTAQCWSSHVASVGRPYSAYLSQLLVSRCSAALGPLDMLNSSPSLNLDIENTLPTTTRAISARRCS